MTESTKSKASTMTDQMNQPKPKRNARKKADSPNSAIARMGDDQYRATFPEAWELFDFFETTVKNAGQLHLDKNRNKSKIAAVEYFRNGLDKVAPLENLKECIRWCFSSAKQSMQFWAKVPVNHLGTVINTMYNVWKETNFSPEATARRQREKALEKYM